MKTQFTRKRVKYVPIVVMARRTDDYIIRNLEKFNNLEEARKKMALVPKEKLEIDKEPTIKTDDLIVVDTDTDRIILAVFKEDGDTLRLKKKIISLDDDYIIVGNRVARKKH